MGYGLQVNDASGRTLLDTSDRCLKVLGSFVIPASAEGYTFEAWHSELAQGTAFYFAQGNCFNLSGYYVTIPVAMYVFSMTVTGTKISFVCDYSSAYKNKWNRIDYQSVDIQVFYGVY